MRGRWMVVALVVVGLLAPACKEASEASEGSSYEPATLEPIEGTDLSQVVLTEDAAARIELQTASVETAPNGQLVVPYAAVFYGLTGETWTYTEPQALTFVRAPVTVESVEGDTAYLSDGPPAGTEVVIVGAAELFGVETSVGT